MDKIIPALQTILNGLTAGIKAVGNIADGTKSFATASTDAANGTGSYAGAFKEIFNFFAGLFGFDALK